MRSDSILQLNGITKKFGEVVVAVDLDLQIEQGQILGIVGPNGAGKSTLFAMISGEIKPDSGAIMLDGADIGSLSAHKRTRAGIGRTFQIPRPFEKMTVFENVLVFASVGANIHGTEAEEFAYETLRRTYLDRYANEPAGALGLLNRKRLEVARGLATQPKVLLLDEVAGGLTDPEVEELVQMVHEFKEGGLTIVWIEHVVRALTETVDRLTCLAGGNFIADGTPEEVFNHPLVREVYLGQVADGEV